MADLANNEVDAETVAYFQVYIQGLRLKNHEKSTFLGQYYNPAYHKQK